MIEKLIHVGGFLGIGKTTLLAEAAKRLEKQGKAVGLVTNDQAPELVDTRLLTGVGKSVAEVAGSCFCCNFNGFVDAIKSLEKQGATIVIAEPVGSCTDLSATIMNPLKKFQPDWKLAPLSVLIDPKRLPEVIGGAKSVVDPDALYIMELQMAEADRILVSKSDLLSDAEKQNAKTMLEKKYPGKKVGFISSKTGEGFDAWLSEIMAATDAGATIVPVDYDRYAHGEAVLGWLNATASVTACPCMDGKKVLTDFLTAFHSEIKKTNSEVGHVKASLNVNGKEWVGNLTALHGSVDVRDTEAKSGGAMMTINARVQTSPEALETLVRELCTEQSITIDSLRCLMPGRPTPTHRFS
jgi:G3E family GTPase